MSNDDRDSSTPPPDRAAGTKIGRRVALQGIGALGVAAAGCGEDVTTVAPDGTGGAGGGAAAGSGGADTGVSVTSSSSASAGGSGEGGAGGAGGGAGGDGGAGGTPAPGCDTGNAGLSPAELLANIETIVVLVMENRSFDHYLGSLLLAEGLAVDGLTGTESNLDPDAVSVPVFKLDNYTPEDPPHDWDSVHAAWNTGLNDGFVKAHADAGAGPTARNEVMGYHVREQLPVLYALADAQVICDRYFCAVLGATWPNRFYIHGGTSKGQKQNFPVTGFTSVFDQLENAGISHKNYFHDLAWASGGYVKLGGLDPIEAFFDAAAAGTLPQFSIIDPKFFGDGANDDHPPHDAQLGQALIASIYAALAQSPQWGKCLFVITYDEHGGFYDHVPPPMTFDDDVDFRRLGIRVPTIVCGPFVRKGCVVHTQLEHSSIPATVARRFGLNPLTERVAQAADLSSCLDPAYFADPQPPIVLPPVDVSMGNLERAGDTPDPGRARIRTGNEHHELWDLAESGAIPRHLDRRHEGAAVTRRVLAAGARLGAVRLRR